MEWRIDITVFFLFHTNNINISNIYIHTIIYFPHVGQVSIPIFWYQVINIALWHCISRRTWRVKEWWKPPLCLYRLQKGHCFLCKSIPMTYCVQCQQVTDQATILVYLLGSRVEGKAADVGGVWECCIQTKGSSLGLLCHRLILINC